MRLISVCLSVIVSFGLIAVPASAGSSFSGCDEPGSSWPESDPASLGLDPAKLQEAVDFAMTRRTREIHVFRAGCHVAGAAIDEEMLHESYSVAKSVTSLLVGRAVHLGLLEVDDTVGEWFPEAPVDTLHREVTLRQLLTQTSGVHWNFFRDYLIPPDRIEDFFALDFDHQPGTYFEYAQTPITVIAEIVTRAAGEDVQSFAQRELFGPIGIDEGSWSWTRDAAGHTAGYYGLNMRAKDFARLGELVRRDGAWEGEQLIDPGFLADSLSASPTNPAYGYLWWLNGSDEGNIAPTIYGRDVRDRRPIQTAPSDLVMAAGYQDQRIWVVPSLQLMAVRFGYPGSNETDTRQSFWTSSSGEFEHELFRLLGEAVVDEASQEHIPESEPYESPETVPTIDPGYSIVGSALEPEEILEGATRF